MFSNINYFSLLILRYNSNITFHGIFMTSSMIMPILIGGFGNILLPLMLCSSDIIISPALIILMDYDLIIIPSYIIYALGLQ